MSPSFADPGYFDPEAIRRRRVEETIKLHLRPVTDPKIYNHHAARTDAKRALSKLIEAGLLTVDQMDRALQEAQWDYERNVEAEKRQCELNKFQRWQRDNPALWRLVEQRWAERNKMWDVPLPLWPQEAYRIAAEIKQQRSARGSSAEPPRRPARTGPASSSMRGAVACRRMESEPRRNASVGKSSLKIDTPP